MSINKKGFTLVEIMIGVSLITLVAAGMSRVYLIGQQYFKAGVSQLDAQRMSKIAVEKISRGIRHGKNITLLSGNGNSLQFKIDRPDVSIADWMDPIFMANAANKPEIECGFYFTNGDGDDNTIADNVIFYDDDVSAGGGFGSMKAVLGNVGKLNGQPIFSMPGVIPDRIRVQFTVFDNFAADGYQGIDIDTTVELRNFN